MNKKDIIKVYKDIVKEVNRPPTRTDFLNHGVTRDMIRHHFGSLTNLHSMFYEKHPESKITPFEVKELAVIKKLLGVKK